MGTVVALVEASAALLSAAAAWVAIVRHRHNGD